MSRRKSVRSAIGRLAGCVVQKDILHHQSVTARDGEAVNRVVLNDQTFDHRLANSLANGDKVVWLSNTAVRTKTVPPSLAIAVDDCSFLGCDGDIRTGNFDHVIVCVCVGECCRSRECHDSAGLELCQVECCVTRNSDAVKSNVGAGRYSGSDGRVRGNVAGVDNLGVGCSRSGCGHCHQSRQRQRLKRERSHVDKVERR